LRQRNDVGLLDEALVLVAKQILEQDLQRERQPLNRGIPGGSFDSGRELRPRASAGRAS
jgi:hypothetical protein